MAFGSSHLIVSWIRLAGNCSHSRLLSPPAWLCITTDTLTVKYLIVSHDVAYIQYNITITNNLILA